MKVLLASGLAVAVVSGLGVWARTREKTPPAVSKVGTNPGGMERGREYATFKPRDGDEIVGFSAGCFWGAEQAYRRMPGVVATAVGYTGGTTAFPSYEVAHKTGHVETVLVEFDPRKVAFADLLKTYWTLPRSTEAAETSRSAYRPAIWTYNPEETKLAKAGRDELARKLHRQLSVRIEAARPFYLAEDYHQQYDEKSGEELCPALP